MQPLSQQQKLRIEKLVAEHHGPLQAFLRKKMWQADIADIDDMTQEVYFRLSRYQSLDGIDNLRSFIFKIAENALIDKARGAAARHAEHHVNIDEQPEEGATVHMEQAISAEQKLTLLKSAILALPDKTRQVFLLSRFEGQSYPQIAERLGVSVKAVEKHMSKALKICREKVGGFP